MKEKEPKPFDREFTTEAIVAAAISLNLRPEDIKKAKNMEPWDALDYFVDILAGAKNPSEVSTATNTIQKITNQTDIL